MRQPSSRQPKGVDLERRLENRARHAASDVLTDGDYEDLPADVLRDIGASKLLRTR